MPGLLWLCSSPSTVGQDRFPATNWKKTWRTREKSKETGVDGASVALGAGAEARLGGLGSPVPGVLGATPRSDLANTMQLIRSGARTWPEKPGVVEF